MLIQKCTENNKLLHRPAMKNFFPSRAVSCPVLFFCFSFNLKVKPYNKSFIDQACSVKMAGYWPRSFFFCVFMDLECVSVHKYAKKELGQYPAILTEQAWSITHIYFFSVCFLFFRWDVCKSESLRLEEESGSKIL